MAAGLQHPNLVSIYDFDADAEPPYIVMEHMPGGSLRERIDGETCPEPERLAADLLRALAYIHASNVTHRDVKPGNVLFDADERARLSDFGVARAQDATSITQTGQIPGTARYMAPELWRGEPATAASDLYACGVLLTECLGGDGEPRLAELAAWLSADLPDLRPRSAEAALAVLEEPARPAPVEPTTVETEPVKTTARPAGDRRLGVLALAALALVVALIIASGGEENPSAQRGTAAGDQGVEEGQPAPAGDEGTGQRASEGASPPPPASDPAALNDQGFALIGAGRYDEAIPILEQAVAGLEGSGDITYAYALYNLGNALRLAGRPAEAIPVLERRLEIPNQTETVRAELKQAQQDLKAQEKAAKKAE